MIPVIRHRGDHNGVSDQKKKKTPDFFKTSIGSSAVCWREECCVLDREYHRKVPCQCNDRACDGKSNDEEYEIFHCVRLLRFSHGIILLVFTANIRSTCTPKQERRGQVQPRQSIIGSIEICGREERCVLDREYYRKVPCQCDDRACDCESYHEDHEIFHCIG